MRRRRSSAPARPDDERGAVLVLVALTMVVLLIVTAIVIDLGYARGGAGFDQSSADLAALAGGDALAERKYVEACQDIVTYLNSNTQASFDSAGLCAGFAGTVCSGGSTAQVTPTATSGRYDLSIRFPVPDAEIADATFGAGRIDGLPCERMRVVITSRQPSFFGGIAGASSYSVTRTATIRGGDSQTRLVPSLWLLDPVGCTVLSVSGGSRVTAGDISNPSDPNPGVITIDSDGSAGCSATQPTLDAAGSGTEIRAVPVTGAANQRGEISLVALPFNATTCDGSVACKQSQVGIQVFPQPIPAEERSTRAPVDWLWNCQETYPDYLSIPIEGCPATDEREPYIDQLIAGVRTSGRPDASYQRWTDFHSCSPSGNISVTGNWWVDCPTPGGLSINGSNSVTFASGNVVFDGGIKLLGSGALNINTANTTANLPFACLPPAASAPCIGSASGRAAFIYVRNGDWTLGGGTFRGKNTMMYLSPDSELKGTGGSPPVWSAPTEGPFAGLALWAESYDPFTISGGAGVALQGTFFTPFANDLTLTGGGNWGQQNAQFISYRLTVSGGSVLTMAPDPTTAANLPPPQATLIR